MSDKLCMEGGILSIGRVFSGEPIRVELPSLASADVSAADRFARNLAVLQITQPKLSQWVKFVRVPMQWAFARDGYLTAKDGDAWWRGCSVPLLAGREMLRKLELSGSVACFVCPSHAGEIRACFERILPHQAIVAVVPDPLTLAVILRCDDFSPEICAGRLLIAGGWDWADQLTAIFEAQPGLPMPQNFVRTVLIDDEELNRFATEAQNVISEQTARRAQRITLIRESAERSSRRSGRVLVVASGYLRVSDLSGTALAATLCAEESDNSAVVWVDPDYPMSASPVAVALASAECDAIVTTNTFRSGFGGIVPANRPWITWVTHGPHCIQSPDANGQMDRLLLADPDWRTAARQAGWRDDQIEIAGWPDRLGLFSAQAAKGKYLGLQADIRSIEVPEQLKEVSSHRLLWELIAQELSADPLALGLDPQAFLQQRMAKLGVAAEKFDATLFFERLILPAYWAGLARAAANAGLPLALIGRGWEKWPDLADYVRGPADSPRKLAEQIQSCAAMIHPIPTSHAHPIDVLGRAVVQPGGLNLNQFLQAAREALAGRSTVKRRAISPLSLGRVVSLIPKMHWPQSQDDTGKCSD